MSRQARPSTSPATSPSARHDLTVIHVPIEDVMPYAANAKLHPLWKIAELAAGINEFGWTEPCLIDEDGTLIAGHGRVQAALKLEMTTVPCIRLVGLSDTAKRSLRLFDNRMSDKGGYDDEMLKLELGELRELGVDLTGIGWSVQDLNGIFGEPDGDEPKPVPPEPPKEWLVVVECSNENEQAEVYDRLTREGVQCKIM